MFAWDGCTKRPLGNRFATRWSNRTMLRYSDSQAKHIRGIQAMLPLSWDANRSLSRLDLFERQARPNGNSVEVKDV